MNIRNKRDETALHYAIRMNREELVLLLLQHYASVDIRARDGTPEELAAATNNPRIIEIIKTYKSTGTFIQKKPPNLRYLDPF